VNSPKTLLLPTRIGVVSFPSLKSAMSSARNPPRLPTSLRKYTRYVIPFTDAWVHQCLTFSQPFPPAPEKSKLDLQIESGEFFFTKQAKERAVREEREKKRKEKQKEKQAEREKDFVPPTEVGDREKSKKRKREGETKEECKARKEEKRKRKGKAVSTMDESDD